MRRALARPTLRPTGIRGSLAGGVYPVLDSEFRSIFELSDIHSADLAAAEEAAVREHRRQIFEMIEGRAWQPDGCWRPVTRRLAVLPDED